MVISVRLKSLLYEQLVLPKHYLYPAEIWNPRTNETRTDYYVMHIVNNIFEEIDIDNSEFGNFHIREKRIQSKIEKGLLKSISDIEKINEELFITSHGKVEPLLMKFKDDTNLDIFCLEPYRVFVYITSKAKEILTANNISGIDFIELSFDDVV